MDWNMFWTGIFGTNEYFKIPRVVVDFYFHLFIEIQEAEDTARLKSIERDWSELLDGKSAEAVSTLINLDKAELANAYTSFLKVSGIVGGADRYSKRSWSFGDFSSDEDSNQRFWFVNTYYQFAKDNYIKDWSKSNDARFCGIDILCGLVGIFDSGWIINSLINDQSVRLRIHNPQNNVEFFLAFIYIFREGSWLFSRDQVSHVIERGMHYFEVHIPVGYSIDQLRQLYPIFFEWLERKTSNVRRRKD